MVVHPYDPQDYNRYSYCRNNPLIYTDPSGNFGWLVAAIIGAIVGAVTSAIAGEDVGKGALVGAVGGAIFGLGAQFGYMGAIAGGMASGAVTSAMTGGDIGKGILIGALAGMLVPIGGGGGWYGFKDALYGAAEGFFIGGIAAELYGGDFIEGAGIGAFGGFLGGFLASEESVNFFSGYGWQSNQQVINHLYSSGHFQAAIDFATNRYGLNPGSQHDTTLPRGTRGVTNMRGNVRIGPDAFSQSSLLQGTIAHEQLHRSDVLAGIPRFRGGSLVNRGYMEGRAYGHTLKNAGRLHLSPNVNKYYHQRHYDYTGRHFSQKFYHKVPIRNVFVK